MESCNELIELIERLFESLDAGIDECKRVQEEKFGRLTQEFDVEQRLEVSEKDFNVARALILDELKRSLSERVNQLKMIVYLDQQKSKMQGFLGQVQSEIAFTPMPTDSDCINIGCFVDLVYKNSFSIEQKVDYLGLYESTKSSIRLDFLKQEDIYNSNWIVMPISRNRLVHYHDQTLRIIDSKLRVLLKINVPNEKVYQNVKVYGHHIVATGIRTISSGRDRCVCLDVYDTNIRLRATKKFKISSSHHRINLKLERVSKDIFMHRYSADEEVYTLFDFELNTIVQHRKPLQKLDENTLNIRIVMDPFFFDGDNVKEFTRWHLSRLIDGRGLSVAEHKKRLLNFYTSQEIKWKHVQEANKIDAWLFDYREKPRTLLAFNLDRDVFDCLEALNAAASDLRTDWFSYNCTTEGERYRGGLTEYGDLFFMRSDMCYRFV